ncbi:cell division protein SepF [Jatrophihabitans telluris]|uniref:cell division protein SepF n=1 Tax=Jatrophihabitans telluris TaxID=2038343 RepID=UPI0024BFF136|nr:cell division protein SepF [Jatrophihabitans telluris]
MATAFRKMGVYLGLVEDDEYPEGTESYGALARDPQYTGRREVEVSPPRGYDAATTHDTHAEGYEEEYGFEAAYEPQPLQRITTLHPRTYNEAKTIGLQFRGGTPVIMNLTEMDDADAKRLVDFAAGLTFGLHGSIERVTPKVFLLSPHNVSVTAADKQRIVEGGFYNQS